MNTQRPQSQRPSGLYQNQTHPGNGGSRSFFRYLCCLLVLVLASEVSGTPIYGNDLEQRDRPAVQIDATKSVDPVAPVAIVSHDDDYQWRLTRFGWQSKYNWQERHTDALPPVAIHPLLCAPALILGLLLALIWTTEEWDFDQMFPMAAGSADETQA